MCEDFGSPSSGVVQRANSGKYSSILDFPANTFSARRSCLFRNKMTEMVRSHLKRKVEKDKHQQGHYESTELLLRLRCFFVFQSGTTKHLISTATSRRMSEKPEASHSAVILFYFILLRALSKSVLLYVIKAYKTANSICIYFASNQCCSTPVWSPSHLGLDILDEDQPRLSKRKLLKTLC